MVEPQPPREVRHRLAILQHAEDVSRNVSMTCRHYGISQPVYSTRLRRYRERASTTIAVMPIRPSDSHAIKNALQTRAVIAIRDRPTRPQRTGEAPTRLSPPDYAPAGAHRLGQ